MYVHAFTAGLLGGLGVALPLGAIGLLIVQTGIRSGRTVAAAGACGVAFVDFVYAVIAVSASAAVAAWVTPHEQLIKIIGAIILVGVALNGLWSLRTPAGDAGTLTAESPVRAFAKFVGLTAINPLTAVYFAVLATSLSGTLPGLPERAVFVGAVLLASLAWQLVLAMIGSTMGSRVPPRVRTFTTVLGYGLVAMMALRLGLTA
jgi:arginine exporter protein ArgO